MTHSPRCASVAWHRPPCIPSRMARAPCPARPALAPAAHSCLDAHPTRRRPIASSLRLPCSWLTAVSASPAPSPQRHWHLLAAPALAATSAHFLALLLLALPSLALATLRLGRRCRSFSPFSSSRTRSCAGGCRHTRWFHTIFQWRSEARAGSGRSARTPPSGPLGPATGLLARF